MSWRKRLTFLILSLVNVSLLFSQNLAGHNICLDPGHGPGNHNQGPTGLHEHEINWRVAVALKEYLLSAGMDTVLLTRDSTENPSLSQREYVANQFGAEWFHSIHHNATGWSQNNTYRYTLLLYEELSNHQPQWPGQSDVMSNYMAQFIQASLRTTHWVVYGDYTFYGQPSYLGVLNDLGMPGELSEATFHDHPWEEAKLYNPMFTKLEAKGIFKAICQYLNAGDFYLGSVSGIIRDAIDNNYLNNVMVILDAGADTTYVDNHNSGFYGFDGLTPGVHYIMAQKDGYEPVLDSVLVESNQFNFLDMEMMDVFPPIVTTTIPEEGEATFPIWGSITLDFNKPMNRDSTSSALSLSPWIDGNLKWSNQNMRLTFDPYGPLLFDTTYSLTLLPRATDTYGHPLDGNGDGAGGDPFTLTFHTEEFPLDYPYVIDIYPLEQSTPVFPLEVIKLFFNKAMNPETMTGDRLLLMNSLNHREEGFASYFQMGDSVFIYSFCTFEPMRSNDYHRATLLNSVEDTSGNHLPAHFTFNFQTADLNGEFTLFDLFRDLHHWSQEFQLSEVDSYFVDTSDTLGIINEGYVELEIDFSAYEGSFTFKALESIQGDYYYLQPSDFLVLYFENNGDSFRVDYNLRWDGGEYTLSDTIGWLVWGCSRVQIPAGYQNSYIQSITLRPLSSLQINARVSRLGRYHLTPLGIREQTESPIVHDYLLLESYPNPFNSHVCLKVTLKKAAQMSIQIFNLQGRTVKNLVRQRFNPGSYLFYWDGTNTNRQKLSSGIYIVKVRADNQIITSKITLIY